MKPLWWLYGHVTAPYKLSYYYYFIISCYQISCQWKLGILGVVGAKLHYCNSLLYGTSEGNLDRLQHIQNQHAHVVLQAPWTASATDMRRQLHWLSVRQRIVFKLAAVTYKAQLSGLLAYLQRDIHDYHPSRTLHSTLALLLQQQPATISFAASAFCAAAPTVWNSLGVHTRSANTFLTFKNRLKTELLVTVFWHHCSAPDSLANWRVGARAH